MDNQEGLLRWGGWGGLVGTLAFVVTIVVTSVLGTPSPPENAGDVGTYLAELSDQSVSVNLYAIAGIVLSLTYVPMVLGVQRLLADSATAVVATIAMVAGLMVLLLAYVGALLPQVALVDAGEALGRAGDRVVYADYVLVSGVVEVLFTVGSALTLCIGPLLWGLDALGSGRLARWLAWLALGVGVTGLAWFVWLVDTPVALFGTLFNLLASLVLFVGLSLALLRESGGTVARS